MSGRKLTLPTYTLLNAVSMATSVNATPTTIINMDQLAIEMLWSGSNPVGTIQVAFSNSLNGTYIADPTLTVTPGGAPGNAFLNIRQVSAPYVQVQYVTAGGSSGTLTVTISGKML